MNSGIKQLIIITLISLLGTALYGQELTNKIAWSIKYGHTENLKDLITVEHINECVGVADSKKYNYLVISIKLKSMKSLRYFVENGADIEGVCADKTPLMYAAKYGQLEMARYLVQNGADLNATYKGKTALSFARQFHQRDIVKYIKEHEKTLKTMQSDGYSEKPKASS
ncbi:MAG: ankyrin repeat domain-containing protein [Maribacter sp.]|nr:ankyrin repeat domain-containing protein [Maribacter sp.]MBT8313221.1 ankyrin repeat domain-containing protein [Maribacter sp.]